jgi:hypothetical protein
MSNILATVYEGGIAITASNTANDPAGPFAALYIGGAGTAVVVDLRGNSTTYAGLLAGTILPVQCVRVNSTGLTASNIVGLRAAPIGGP